MSHLEHVSYLSRLGFEIDKDGTSENILSFTSPSNIIHLEVKKYFKMNGYVNDDGRVYMRHTGNPHVNLTNQDGETVQVSWSRILGTGVTFLFIMKGK